jgi:ABC-type multidrug transport system fused ATPase/permease subunit
MAADHVVVLDGARVVDQGDPRELADRSAAFARLFEIDLSPVALTAKGDRAGVS